MTAIVFDGRYLAGDSFMRAGNNLYSYPEKVGTMHIPNGSGQTHTYYYGCAGALATTQRMTDLFAEVMGRKTPENLLSVLHDSILNLPGTSDDLLGNVLIIPRQMAFMLVLDSTSGVAKVPRQPYCLGTDEVSVLFDLHKKESSTGWAPSCVEACCRVSARGPEPFATHPIQIIDTEGERETRDTWETWNL